MQVLPTVALVSVARPAVREEMMSDAVTSKSAWWRVGAVLLIGLFVAYIDRTNLSVALPQLSMDLGFAGEGFAGTNSLALTIFLIGYAVANVLGGFLTRRIDPKTVVIVCFGSWSIATIIVGVASSLYVLLACRFVLGVAEGIYWPQQSRFARAWFAPKDLTKANSLIQYYGQFLALAIGFVTLTPVYDAFGWRALFLITGGLGIVVIVPLYLAALKPEGEAPFRDQMVSTGKLSLAAFGGPAFVLIVFSYITQGMLFWGITLWIPLAVRSLGFTGMNQAVASALPYAAAVGFAIPMAIISDRTGRRVLIAALGMILPGFLLLALPLVDSGVAKLTMVTIALGYRASSFTPNIWSILQSNVEPQAVGSAAGIMNGLGAGGGGTIAGFLVGLLQARTGSYLTGFMVLGALVIVGGVVLLIYGSIMRSASS
jgi:MFS family permease